MLSPSELERIPLETERLFSRLEDRIMKDIVGKIRECGKITSSADYLINRLSDMGYSSRMIKDEIRRLLKLTEKEINKIYDEAIKEGYVRDEELYTASGKAFVPYEENRELLELADMIRLQTKEKFTNITNSMGFSVVRNGKREFLPIAEYYQSTLDKAAVDITTGTFDYNTVLSRTVREMVNSGLRTVDYASGHSDRIEVAARRAVMTGVNQLSAFRTQQIMKELGTDLVEVSWHATARPTHQVWQGRVYRWKEFGEQFADPEDGKAELSSEEKHAVMSYLGGGKSYVINEALRDGTLSEEDEKYVDILDSALKKLPKYEGTVTRSLSFMSEEALDKFLTEHTQYGRITEKSYISTTYGDTYDPDGQVQITIRDSRNGRLVSGFNRDIEKEVLYERNQRFRTIKWWEYDGKYYLEMEEA